MNFAELLDSAPDNLTIVDALGKCHYQVKTHQKIMCSVSGGSDSDVMLDMIIRCGGKDKTTFVFFNTGLEYEATKKQIQFLNEKYGVEIQVIPPIKPIPLCVREYGVPFLSKRVSEMIMRLQKHNFQWEDEPLDVLLEKYPRCQSAIRWWCNGYPNGADSPSRLNIAWVPWLKEFLISNPPKFKISPKCCHYSKKEPANRYMESQSCDLNCTGVRKTEGGARATAYKNCFTAALGSEADKYRPLFWFSDVDKAEYDKHYGVKHSDCYEVWGMKRTGCAGCPFGKNYEEELMLAEKYEPKFYKAMLKVFGQSYEYRRQFEAFREEMRANKQ